MNDCNRFGCKKLVTRCEACGRTANEIVMPKAEWISIKDKMPKEHQWILMGKRGFVEAGVVQDGRFYQPDIDLVRIGITHWMPLPEPPND